MEHSYKVDNINFKIDLNSKDYNINDNDMTDSSGRRWIRVSSEGRIPQRFIEEIKEKFEEHKVAIEALIETGFYNEKNYKALLKECFDDLLLERWQYEIVHKANCEHRKLIESKIESLEGNCQAVASNISQKIEFYTVQKKKLLKKLKPGTGIKLDLNSIFTPIIIKKYIDANQILTECYDNYNIPTNIIYNILVKNIDIKEKLKQYVLIKLIARINYRITESPKNNQPPPFEQKETFTTTKQQMLLLHYLGIFDLIENKTTLPNTKKAILFSKILNRNKKAINDSLTYLHAPKPPVKHNHKTKSNLTFVLDLFNTLGLDEYSHLVQRDLNRPVKK